MHFREEQMEDARGIETPTDLRVPSVVGNDLKTLKLLKS